MTDTPALDKLCKEMNSSPLGTIFSRKKILVVRPGSQRRCYNGCFPSSDWKTVWSDWEVFLSNREEVDIYFWKDLNKSHQYKWEKNK